jgi:hypothetical protein
VRARDQLPIAIAQIVEAQAGVVSREQLRLLDVSEAAMDHLLRQGWWRSLAPGVYHTAPSDPSWNGFAWAGVLIGGDGARLGPRASGFLHNLVDEAPRPVDLLVPVGRSARVLVELDGRTGHEGVERFRDMNRDNQFALIEWITLRYGWFDVVHRPCLVAFQIAAALVARGWSGMPTRCSRCVNMPDIDLCG